MKRRVLKNACPDCGADMVLRNSKYGLFYGCVRFPACKAAHGAHPNGDPLGVPASQSTKEWRIRAHEAFDKLWKGERAPMKRKVAYRAMRLWMGLSPEEAHIGRFTELQCSLLIVKVYSFFFGPSDAMARLITEALVAQDPWRKNERTGKA